MTTARRGLALVVLFLAAVAACAFKLEPTIDVHVDCLVVPLPGGQIKECPHDSGAPPAGDDAGG